jgi:transposase
VRRHGGEDSRIGIETGPMTPWLVHELRGRGLAVTCLDARHARAALKMHNRPIRTMRRDWRRSCARDGIKQAQRADRKQRDGLVRPP